MLLSHSMLYSFLCRSFTCIQYCVRIPCVLMHEPQQQQGGLEPPTPVAPTTPRPMHRTGTNLRRRKSIILRPEDRPLRSDLKSPISHETAQIDTDVFAVLSEIAEVKQKIAEETTKLQDLLREADDNDSQITMLRTRIASCQSRRERELRECAESTIKLNRDLTAQLAEQAHLDETIGGEERYYAACKQALAQQSVQLAFNFEPRSSHLADAEECSMSSLFSADALARNTEKQSDDVLAWWRDRKEREAVAVRATRELEAQEWYQAELQEKLEMEERARRDAIRAGKVVLGMSTSTKTTATDCSIPPPPTAAAEEAQQQQMQRGKAHCSSSSRYARAAERAIGKISLGKLLHRSSAAAATDLRKNNMTTNDGDRDVD